MALRTKAEIEEIEADLAYWQGLSALIPDWQVYGWNHQHSASYLTTDEEGRRHVLDLTGSQRDSIVKAITAGGNT